MTSSALFNAADIFDWKFSFPTSSKTGFFHDVHGLFIDVGEYKCNSFTLAGFYQVLKCIHGGSAVCKTQRT